MAGLVSAAAFAPVVARPGVARRANAGRGPAAVARVSRVNARASLNSIGSKQVRSRRPARSPARGALTLDNKPSTFHVAFPSAVRARCPPPPRRAQPRRPRIARSLTESPRTVQQAAMPSFMGLRPAARLPRCAPALPLSHHRLTSSARPATRRPKSPANPS